LFLLNTCEWGFIYVCLSVCVYVYVVCAIKCVPDLQYQYTHKYIYLSSMHIFIYRERTDCISGYAWGVYRRQERERVLDSENYWNIAYMYEDNITQCTVSCLIIGEQGDRERVIEGVNLIKTWYIHVWSA
jgi:hypothetical protein